MKQIISGILNILNKRERVRISVHILLDLLIGILDITFLGLTLLVINFYTTGIAAASGPILKWVPVNGPVWFIALFFLLFCLKNWLAYRITASQNHFYFGVASRLSERNMRYYLNNDYFHYTGTDSSVHIRRISQQPVEFANYILLNAEQMITQSILVMLAVTGILFYHPSLFVSLFILLLPPVILLGYFIKRKLRFIRAGNKVTSQKAIQYLQESLSGYIESNMYGKEDFFTQRYYQYQQQLNQNIATQQSLQGLPPRLVEVFAILGFLILVTLNKLLSGTKGVNLLDTGIFLAAAYKIIPGVVKILNSSGQIKTYEFTINDLLIKEVDHNEKQNTPPEPSISKIDFNQVSFRYKDHQILDNVSFKMQGGDFIGISGPSGIGKSTIVNLLTGFLREDSGEILINKKTADASDRQTYRRNISYLKQQPFFINDSILKNITLDDDELYDQDRFCNAISVCGLNGLISKYPEGINMIITENGKNISGGQRQRMMLARALYHDFDLLVLDEPLGEVDEGSEKEILEQLKILAGKGKMIIMITHNKASMAYCDKVIYLDGR